MKRKGYLFIEFILVVGLFSVIIFPLIILMDRNINNLNYIRNEYEIRKLTRNLENIFVKIEKGGENKNYYLVKDENEKGSFVLEEETGKIVTKLRGIKMPPATKISISKSKIFFEEDKNDETKKNFTEIFILEIKIKDKIIKKILPL